MAYCRLIINPVAGRGLGERLRPAILEALQHHGLRVDTISTSEQGAGTRLAQEALEAGYELIVAVGGDGILHEIVHGLMIAGAGPSDMTLGIIPTGSGNDFAKMLNLPAGDVTTACKRIGNGQTRVVDVGQINFLSSGNQVRYSAEEGRPAHFINMLGIGFTALVAYESQKIKWLTGLPLYLWAALRTLASSYQTPDMRIDLDGHVSLQPTTEVAVANGRCQGDGFWMTPNAEIDDGLFDIVIARKLSRLGILWLIPHIMRGTHVNKKPVTMARARYVKIETSHPLPVQADGEILTSQATHLELEVIPRALKLFA